MTNILRTETNPALDCKTLQTATPTSLDVSVSDRGFSGSNVVVVGILGTRSCANLRELRVPESRPQVKEKVAPSETPTSPC